VAKLSQSDALSVLSRLTYGTTEAESLAVRELGLKTWIENQLSSKRTETHPLLQNDSAFLSKRLTLRETYNHPNFRRRFERVSSEVAGFAAVSRAFSTNQIRETLVEFISDYVPVPLFSDADWARMDYDRVIRDGINATFPKLLASLAMHPAMLFYLNGQTNTASHPNENFGRELLELFTVTTRHGYKESDVLSASKMLSGISFSLVEYKTIARPTDHYFGPINVLGFTHNNPRTDSSDVILSRASQMIIFLAKLPATAKEFSRRMATRYLSDKPDAKLLSAMEKTYLDTQGNIFAVLTTMALHPAFLSTPPSKVKRPAEHMFSSMRALGLDLSSQLTDKRLSTELLASDALNPLLAILSRQGHIPFDWETPDGFPDQALSWSTFGGQIQRWNLTSRLGQGNLKSIFSDPVFSEKILGFSDIPDLVGKVTQTLLSAGMRASDETEIVKLLQKNEPRGLSDMERRKRLCGMCFALVMASEEWNLR
jgi:uncharacterized protein (DUF1800 family)